MIMMMIMVILISSGIALTFRSRPCVGCLLKRDRTLCKAREIQRMNRFIANTSWIRMILN
jgi:hypothetical protein